MTGLERDVHRGRGRCRSCPELDPFSDRERVRPTLRSPETKSTSHPPRSTPTRSRWPWRRSARAGCCHATRTCPTRCWRGNASICFDDWLCVGRSSDVPVTGGLRAESVGGYGVLLTRDADGVLRAFENACRHRGHELLPCGGSAQAPRAIVCPYHAWSYRHDGSLIGAPGLQGHRRLRQVDARPQAGARCTSGTAGSSSTAPGTAKDFAEHIGELEDDRRAVRRASHWSPPSPTSTTSRPTGRSSSRTTRSATTAR